MVYTILALAFFAFAIIILASTIVHGVDECQDPNCPCHDNEFPHDEAL